MAGADHNQKKTDGKVNKWLFLLISLLLSFLEPSKTHITCLAIPRNYL
jgi:hypothetical protein